MFAEESKVRLANEENVSLETTLPVAGLRVLDLGNMIAGPFCSHLLADFGAEVIKVELPSGDPLRGWRAQYKGMSLFWMILGRNKKTITLNLRHPVQPQEVVDKGPASLAKRASIGLSCIYEKKRYEHSTKDGCL